MKGKWAACSDVDPNVQKKSRSNHPHCRLGTWWGLGEIGRANIDTAKTIVNRFLYTTDNSLNPTMKVYITDQFDGTTPRHIIWVFENHVLLFRIKNNEFNVCVKIVIINVSKCLYIRDTYEWKWINIYFNLLINQFRPTLYFYSRIIK